MMVLVAVWALVTLSRVAGSFSERETIGFTDDSSLDVVTTRVLSVPQLLLAGIALAITVGLARRSNVAWTSSVIGTIVTAVTAGKGILDGGANVAYVVTLVLMVAVLGASLMPATIVNYRPKKGRNQLSVGRISASDMQTSMKKLVGIGVFFVVVLALFALMASGG
jgi:hypothetical protein